MPKRETIDDVLQQKHLAFVGASRNSKAFANVVYRRLREGGRTMYPVNARAGGAPLEGDASYPTLADVPEPLDGVVVMVAADRSAGIVRQALERHVPRVWLHKGLGAGALSEEAVALCRGAGIEVVEGACPLMFLEPVRGIHHLHARLARRRLAA